MLDACQLAPVVIAKSGRRDIVLISAAPYDALVQAAQVDIGGEALYLAAHPCAAVPAKALEKPVTSVSDRASRVVDALDAVMSGV